MLVADTAALISLSTARTLSLVHAEFEVHVTETVRDELENTAEYDDAHGSAARDVLDERRLLTAHDVDDPEIESARIDGGEASCLALCRKLDAEFLLTDDLRALPELQVLTDAQVAISPIVLKALVKRDVLRREDAEQRLELLVERRDWFGAPIYRRARSLFGSE